MVGPTPDAEYDAAVRRLLIGFVLFVGVSSMFGALYGGATLLEVGLVGLVGVVVGAATVVAIGAWP